MRNKPQETPLEVRPPRWWTLGVFLVIWSIVAVIFYRPSSGIINWYATVVWTLPFSVGVIGIYGAFLSRPIIKQQPVNFEDVGVIDDPLHVVITTIGADRILGALTRVIRSTGEFATHFSSYTVHIVTEEGCEALDAITVLAESMGAHVMMVPASYETPSGSRFKARASQYSLERLVKSLGGIDKIPTNHWTYRLDDDTSIDESTVRKLVAFVAANRSMDGKHLGQGILAYARQHSHSLLMWLADSIRTFDDLGRFPFTTARGTPRAGLHGENMIVRTCIEAQIGWDFGPNEIVEDSHFALLFAKLFRGRSAWISARCFGATPTTSSDFVRQRGRWAEGMEALAFNRSIPLGERLLVMHNMLIWSLGIFQPALTVAFISFMVNDYNVAPVTPYLAPVWVVSVSYTYWAYWEGLRQNAYASGRKAPTIWQRVLILPSIVWFSLLEGAGGTYGVLRHFTRRYKTFDGIAKPM